MNEEIAAELRTLHLLLASLGRRIDALHADIDRVARTAVRFGREIELRERGYE